MAESNLGLKKKLKIVRFNAKSDILLLTEVIATNPFITKNGWSLVADKAQEHGLEIDSRRARERTMLLIEYYKKDTASLRRWGLFQLMSNLNYKKM